jgi:hypothetical protein
LTREGQPGGLPFVFGRVQGNGAAEKNAYIPTGEVLSPIFKHSGKKRYSELGAKGLNPELQEIFTRRNSGCRCAMIYVESNDTENRRAWGGECNYEPSYHTPK